MGYPRGESTGRDRGLNEIMGLILLIGLVAAGAMILFLSATSVNSTMQEQQQVKSAKMQMSNIDSKLGSLSMEGNRQNGIQIDMPDAGEGSTKILPQGTTITFSLNGTSECSATATLGLIRYTDKDGNVIAYEGGGVFRVSQEGETHVIQAPDLKFNDQSIRLAADNLTESTTTAGSIQVTKDVDRSRRQSQSFTRDLLTNATGGRCLDRESLHITVDSQYQRAWYDYLREEFPDTAEVNRSGGAVTLVLDTTELRGFDSDGDGSFDRTDNCPDLHNPSQSDMNDDDQGNPCDDDVDGDDTLDENDRCRRLDGPHDDADGDGIGDRCDPDRDGDDYRNPIPDAYDGAYNDSAFAGVDNCPGEADGIGDVTANYNPDQTDIDGDGEGDVCDSDDDGDSKDDGTDNCPKTYNPLQNNEDASEGGHRGDACDPDDDGDSYNDTVNDSEPGKPGSALHPVEDSGEDNCPKTYNTGQYNNDTDEMGDACDEDDDNDGVNDRPDRCPVTATPGGESRHDDTDGKGRGDACDPDDDGDGYYDSVASDSPVSIDESRFRGEDNCPKVWNPRQGLGCSTGGGGGATPPTTNADFVDLQSIDATSSKYRKVTAYVSVDTRRGRRGRLGKNDFEVFEEGNKRNITDVTHATGTSVDIVFAFDDTGSMGGEIDYMQRQVKDFALYLESKGLNARYGLVTFKDSTEVDQRLTGNIRRFKSAVDAMSASGGDDAPEDSYDAIWEAATFDFRPDAQKVIIHITDRRSHDGDRSSHDPDAVVDKIKTVGGAFFTISNSWWKSHAVVEDTNGEYMRLHSRASRQKFLQEIEKLLVSRYKVTFKSCLAANGNQRDVSVYASSGTDTAVETGEYTAPPGPERTVCPGAKSNVRDDRPFDRNYGSLSTTSDAAFPPGPSCSSSACFVATDRARFPLPPAPDPYSRVISVSIDVIELKNDS